MNLGNRTDEIRTHNKSSNNCTSNSFSTLKLKHLVNRKKLVKCTRVVILNKFIFETIKMIQNILFPDTKCTKLQKMIDNGTASNPHKHPHTHRKKTKTLLFRL